jgi:hypothetical protein
MENNKQGLRIEEFKKHLIQVIKKHRRQTLDFNLQLGQWGNTEPMLKRIRQELVEKATKYQGDAGTKQELIDSAIENIKYFYSR